MQFGTNHVNKLSCPRAMTLVIVADGLRGAGANILGISDEFIQESCKSFCAVSSMEREDQHNLPTPENRVFRLKMDLSAFGAEFRIPDISRAVFFLKIFGTFRNRYMMLMCNRGDSNLVRQLRLNVDPMVRKVLIEIKQCCVLKEKLMTLRILTNILTINESSSLSVYFKNLKEWCSFLV